MARGGPTL
ncbi:hypothetical protein A2U01_0114260, partial [Trifolium medium]|nr:hypothetical protein [Trifolium medium]